MNQNLSGEQFEPVRQVISSFVRSNENARAWTRTQKGDELDDACEKVSQDFTEHARGLGMDAHVVEADEATHPYVDYHRWTRVQHEGRAVNVDFTARQLRNLDYPPNPEHHRQTREVPLVWEGEGPEHPVKDAGYTRVRRLDS